MHNLKFFIALLTFLFCIDTAHAQIPKLEQPGAQILKFKSAINDQEYVLYVQLPANYSDTTKKYPVLYALDGQWLFPELSSFSLGLHSDGFTPEMIIVGITWPDNYFGNRDRDFFPTQVKEFPNSGGAPKFLDVIKNEIIKRIDSTYHTDKKNNVLCGHSSAGLFTLYVLFHEPNLFNSYIVLSPSLWYDNEVIFKFENAFAGNPHNLNAKLFISCGEYEEEMDPVTFNKFNDRLKASKYKGLVIEKLVVDKMSHQTMVPYALHRGLQFVFRKPDIMVDTLSLDKYTGHYEQGVIITRTASSLYIEMMGGKSRLHAATNESFYVNGFNGTFEFTKDDKANVTGFNFKVDDKALYSAKKLH